MKGSLTVEASYIVPMCFFTVLLICYLGIFEYNQAVLKITGYECLLQVMGNNDIEEEEQKEMLLKKTKEMAQERVLSMESIDVSVKMTATKVWIYFEGMQVLPHVQMEVSAVYERTFPELTLRMI